MKSEQFLIHLISLFSIAFAAMTTTTIALVESQSISLPDCPDHCGGIKVPYPFGTSQKCSLSGKFLINCTQFSRVPFLNDSNLQITNISLDGELNVRHYIGRDCYNEKGERETRDSPELWLKDFNVSTARNKFIAVGCDTYATVSGYRGEREYVTGCVSSCDDIDVDSSTTESCSGVGCCQTSIPSGLKNISLWVTSYYNHTFVYDFNVRNFYGSKYA